MLAVVYYVAASVDGYIASPDGGIDWLSAVEVPGEDYGYAEFYRSVDALLLGRHTYEQILSFSEWPYPDKPCWVLSSKPLPASQAGITVTADTPDEVLTELKAQGLKRIWLVGGGLLAGAFRAEGLITEYIISIIPIVLGAGIPLFGGVGPEERLKLVESTSYSSGLVQQRYLRASELPC